MNKRIELEQARKMIFEQTPADCIIDTYEDRDYIEFVCKAGGDTLTYRVYRGGTIVER